MLTPAASSISIAHPEIERGRRAMAAALGVTLADATLDFRCKETGGLPATPPVPPQPAVVPPEAERRLAQECARLGRFSSVILSLARPGGPWHPAGGIDRRSEGVRKGHRTIRMIVSSYSGYQVMDVVLAPEIGTGWRVVDEVMLLGSAS